ncbi:enoyl-CoA hydratase/isomerase family protein [Allosalinactinospora lopnorensis]|uniref:enoyl-CoA hydratase/isomerase family protein n=1 Tax=Allosalinactinospora lopnorensis TaxID=1352348 RepID=UPI000AE2E40A|nr:enoyl-CoA hydratase/isomerase family protein [Allosalinactinospora lopnorensis]
MNTEIGEAAPLVEVHAAERIARITIGNGARHNALSGAGWSSVEQAVRELSHDDHVRVVVIRGRGRTFCAGSDMTEWVGTESDPEAVEDSFARMEAAFRAVEECPVPVVAELRGVAAGAGCQLALACDLRYMADSARIGMPIARLGILASPSFAARLVALAGPSVARRLLYTGRLFNARDAVAAGLVDQIVPASELAERTETVLARIADQPPEAVRAAKQAVAAALRPLREATRENDRPAVSPADFHAAVSAFLG